jgi:hypothetical protein
MFFSLAAIGLLALASPSAARLGEQATATSPLDTTTTVDASGRSVTFDGGEIAALIGNELNQEHWVPKKKFFKHSPMDFYSEEDLLEIPGVQHSAAGAVDVFDMSNRLTNVGYRITTAESGGVINNYDDFLAWTGANLNLQLWTILPRPSIQSDMHWLSSPGMKAGEWRIDSLGSANPLPFRETARTAKVLFTRCPSNPSSLPFVVYAEVVGSRFSKIPAGTTVWELKDSIGNSYFLSGLRGVTPLGSFLANW